MAFKLKAATDLVTFRNHRTIPDPFGTDARFEVRRAGSAEHKRWLQDALLSSPSQAKLMDVAIRRGGKDADVELEDVDLSGADLLRFFRDHRERQVEEALRLLQGWHDVPDENGKPVPFNRKNARELLTYEAEIPVDRLDEYPGVAEVYERANEETQEVDVRPPTITVGWVYVQAIRQAAKDSEAFREKRLEEAAKNSEASSGSID